MKSLCLGLLLLSLVCAEARQISMDGGNITFDAPDDFTPLTLDEIVKKFPMRTGPMEAVGNDTRGVSISYSITSNLVRPEQLPELKESLSTDMIKLVPGMKCLRDEFMAINETQWIFVETTAPTAGQSIHNIEIVTSYHNLMLVVNFNSVASLFDSYHDKLWASLKSIKIKNGVVSNKSLPSSVPAPISAEEEIARGIQAARDGKPDMAVEAYNAALLLKPKMASAQLGLGQMNADKDDYDAAIKNFSEAIVDDPGYAEAYSFRGLTKAETGDAEGAISDANKAVELKPNLPGCYYLRGCVEAMQGNLDQAESDFNRTLQINAHFGNAFLGLGHLRLMQGDYDQALRDFQNASAATRSDSATIRSLGFLDLLTGKPDFALREFQSAADMAGTQRHTESIHLLMWVIQAEQGHGDDANQALSAYLQDNAQPKKEWAKNIGAFLLDQTSEPALIASVGSDKSFKSRSEQCRLWYFVGIKRHLSADDPGAMDAFRKCVGYDLKYTDSYILARARLPQDETLGLEGSWLDSLVHTMGGQRNVIILMVLLLVGAVLFVSLIIVVTVTMVLTSRPKQPRAPRPVDRAPPMK